MAEGRKIAGRRLRVDGRVRVAGFMSLASIAFLACFVWVGYGFSQARPASQRVADGVQTSRKAGDKSTPAAADRDDSASKPKPGPATQPGKEPAKKAVAKKPAAVSGLDIQARRSTILAHLNAIVGLYRASVLPIQKAGEPNDIVYFDQSIELSSQAATYAFQSAQAEATLLDTYQEASGGGEQQRLETTKANVEQQLADLKTRTASLDKQIATAKPSQLAGLREQRKEIEAAIELSSSMDTALQKIVGMSDVQGSAGTGLGADIARLQRSVPELNGKTKVASPQLITLESARSSGVSSQGEVLFDLLETKHELASLASQNEAAQKKALAVRGPISALLRSLISRGQQLSDSAVGTAAPAPVETPQKTTKGKAAAAAAASPASGSATATPAAVPAPSITETLGSITTDFKALSSAAVPLSEEMIVLEQNKANLTAWQTAVEQEYKQILHALLARVVVIAIALGIIFIAGEVWRRATNKYIRDARRRRQLLVVRRVTIGFLSVIVILFGFVTQFNSLATFAGFITAGIAVGLQTILLSVAAYFFIVGRYGVKVGDRITISSVTGDVIDVGLVRFYMMELAGTGVELNPTGRVAVFSNAVLFQAGTPLYKQIPGTQFAWHELIVKLTPAADYEKVTAAIMKEVESVYATYKPDIERQHRDVESWMQAPIPAPAVESRLQFNAGSLQLWARFPVEITLAAEKDEELTKALIKLMGQSDEFKQAFAAPPTIQASVKG